MTRLIYSRKNGQTLVEFALLLPIFLLLIVLIFDFGRAIYYLNALHNAAREGARYGAVNSKNPSPGIVIADVHGITETVKTFAVGLDLSDANFTFVNIDPDYYEVAGGQTNPAIRVELKYDYYPVTPFISFILTDGLDYITLTSDAVMRTEWTPKPLP